MIFNFGFIGAGHVFLYLHTGLCRHHGPHIESYREKRQPEGEAQSHHAPAVPHPPGGGGAAARTSGHFHLDDK